SLGPAQIHRGILFDIEKYLFPFRRSWRQPYQKFRNHGTNLKAQQLMLPRRGSSKHLRTLAERKALLKTHASAFQMPRLPARREGFLRESQSVSGSGSVLPLA